MKLRNFNQFKIEKLNPLQQYYSLIENLKEIKALMHRYAYHCSFKIIYRKLQNNVTSEIFLLQICKAQVLTLFHTDFVANVCKLRISMTIAVAIQAYDG